MSNTEMLQAIIDWVDNAKAAAEEGRIEDLNANLEDIRTVADRLLGRI